MITQAPVSKEHRRKIRKLARKFGIKLSKRYCKDSYEWDGNSIATDNWGRPGSHIVHDIAHWLVSTEELREVPDFGLGQGVDSKIPSDPIVQNEADEESAASVLGILIERQLGMNWHHTYREHSWHHQPFTVFLREKESIRKRGLTTYGGRLIMHS